VPGPPRRLTSPAFLPASVHVRRFPETMAVGPSFLAASCSPSPNLCSPGQTQGSLSVSDGNDMLHNTFPKKTKIRMASSPS